MTLKLFNEFRKRHISEKSAEFCLAAHNFHGRGNRSCSRGRLALLTAARLRNFSFEPRKDRFEKSILNETQYSFPCTGLRRFYISRDRGLRRHFFARSILQEAGDAADKSFVEFSKQAFLTILTLIIDVHIAKKRFYVTLYRTLPNLDFRIKGKNSGGDVEIPIGPEKIVHRAHIGIFGA